MFYRVWKRMNNAAWIPRDIICDRYTAYSNFAYSIAGGYLFALVATFDGDTPDLQEYLVEPYRVIYMCIPLVAILFWAMRHTLDNVIESLVTFITRGDHTVKDFTLKLLFNGENSGTKKYYMASYMYCICIPWFIFMPMVLWSGFIIYEIILGFAIGLLFMVRYVFDVHRNLNKHVADPNAHKDSRTYRL